MPTIPLDDNGCGHTAARHLGSTAPAIPRRGKGPTDSLQTGASRAAGAASLGAPLPATPLAGRTPFAVAHSTHGAMFRVRVTGGHYRNMMIQQLDGHRRLTSSTRGASLPRSRADDGGRSRCSCRRGVTAAPPPLTPLASPRPASDVIGRHRLALQHDFADGQSSNCWQGISAVPPPAISMHSILSTHPEATERKH